MTQNYILCQNSEVESISNQLPELYDKYVSCVNVIIIENIKN